MPSFIVPERPKSVNKSNRHIMDWKALVASYAGEAWRGQSIFTEGALQVTIVFLYQESPIDVDNFVKPILDALKRICYVDDSLITDLDSHVRPLDATFDVSRIPDELIPYLGGTKEVVYVNVRTAGRLEVYLE
jgi:hypothetical protein